MTVVDDLRPLVASIRQIPGVFGLRQHTVTLVTSYWSDEESEVSTSTPITHSGGQPPKVRFLTLKERYAAGIKELALEVGPITPAHSGGGYSADELNPTVEAGGSFHYLVTGPGMATDGSKFALAELRVDKALSYRLILKLSETGQPARPASDRI